MDEDDPVGLTSDESWTVLASKVSKLGDMGRQPSIEELILEADMDDFMKETQEEDLRNRQIEEENEKALASAIEEEEHLTKELEDEALKNMEDEDAEDAEDISSDKEGTSGEGDDEQGTPRTDLDESVIMSSLCSFA